MYLLDANTYIQAKNLHYQMTFCPAYWHWLDREYETSRLCSVQAIFDELSAGNDELSRWVKKRKNHFITVSYEVQERFAEIAQYVDELPQAKDQYKAKFLGAADPWLIATAAVTGATVVSQETRAPANSTQVKIPNVCEDIGVSCITTYQLLNELEARFVLG